MTFQENVTQQMYKSKEISEKLFSSAFEIFQKFLSFPMYLCIRLIYLTDVLKPGISLSMEIMTLTVVYSIFKVLKFRYFFPSLYCSAFLWFLWPLFCWEILSWHWAFFLKSDVWYVLKCYFIIWVLWFMIILALKLIQFL